MTPERAKELLPVMQAFAEGKTVQYLNTSIGWINDSNCNFDPNFEYRIKPEPREWEVIASRDGHIFLAGDVHLSQVPVGAKVIKVREVLDEQPESSPLTATEINDRMNNPDRSAWIASKITEETFGDLHTKSFDAEQVAIVRKLILEAYTDAREHARKEMAK